MLERLSPRTVIALCLAIAFGSLFLRTIVYLDRDQAAGGGGSRPLAGEVSPIVLAYHERPPYYVTGHDETLTGLVGEPALSVFHRSGLRFTLQRMPSKRQLTSITHNRERICAVGWFKNPEREQFARFTLPLYQDRPTVVVTRSELALARQKPTLKALLADTNLVLLTKSGYSYGAYVDALLRQNSPDQETTTGSTDQMLAMVKTGKADYFLAAAEEAEAAIAASGEPARYILYTPGDSPAGNLRYLMCSQQVTQAEIDRINSAISATKTSEEGVPLQLQ